MAQDSFDKALKFTLIFEGGFVNNSRDPGGATNLGVTIGTLSSVTGKKATIADVKKLTAATVAPIYRAHYWDKVAGDDLPAGLDMAAFDFGVHSGPSRGVMSLQRVLGVADDGIIGPATLLAARQADTSLAIQRLCADRLAFLSRLSVFKSFGAGLRSWVLKCESAALSMVSDSVTAMAADAAKLEVAA